MQELARIESYISSVNVLLGHHKDEADKDGRAQHADSTHEGVGSVCLLATEASGGEPYNHAQQPRHAGDRPEDEAAGKKHCFFLDILQVPIVKFCVEHSPVCTAANS